MVNAARAPNGWARPPSTLCTALEQDPGPDPQGLSRRDEATPRVRRSWSSVITVLSAGQRQQVMSRRPARGDVLPARLTDGTDDRKSTLQWATPYSLGLLLAPRRLAGFVIALGVRPADRTGTRAGPWLYGSDPGLIGDPHQPRAVDETSERSASKTLLPGRHPRACAGQGRPAGTRWFRRSATPTEIRDAAGAPRSVFRLDPSRGC